VELGGLDLSLRLELADKLSPLPASLLSQLAEIAEGSAGLHSLALESIRDDHPLFVVIWEGDALEHSESTECVGTNGFLMWEHTTNSLPKDARWGPPVFVSSAWVGVNMPFHGLLSVHLASVETSRFENFLATDHDNALSTE